MVHEEDFDETKEIKNKFNELKESLESLSKKIEKSELDKSLIEKISKMIISLEDIRNHDLH